MRSPLPHQIPYRADIDGLRAFAVISVILFHAHPDQLPGGFIGVDVFFVISGFLISSLLLNSAQNSTFSFLDFYSRRIRRILPALVIVLATVFVAGWVLQLPRDFSDLNKLILSSIFFVPNIRLWTQAGYFATDANLQPLLHLWSLGVEEQFYLGWPLLVLLFWRRQLPWIIGLLIAASFFSAMFLVVQHPNAVFYLPVTRLWELLVGAFVAWRDRLRPDSRSDETSEVLVWHRIASWLGIALLLGGDLFIDSKEPFPSWSALIPVLGATLLIVAGERAPVNRHLLADRAVVSIGLISYPLYLWHWPILVFMRLNHQAEPTAIAKNIAILVAGFLAWLTYKFVEKPIRSQKGKQGRRAMVVGLVASSLAIAGISGAVIQSGGIPWRYPSTLRPFLTFDYGESQAYGGRCLMKPNEMGDVWLHLPCVDPKRGIAEPLLALWGDSHAAQLEPGLRELQLTHKFRLAQWTSEGCAPFVSVNNPYQPLCRSKASFFLEQIIQMKPDMVILAAAWYDQGIAPLSETITLLKNAGISRIVVVGPVPRWQGYLPEMLVRAALLNGNKVPTSFGSDKYNSEPEAALKALAQKAGVQYISAIDALCPSGQCKTVTGPGPQNVLSLDYYNLTNSGSVFLVQRISGQLLSAFQRSN